MKANLKIAHSRIENEENNPVIEAFLKWIAMKEEDVLHKTLIRFCLYKRGKIDISRVDFRTFEFEGKPNYVEYYYMGKVFGSDERKHILMSRNLMIIPGQQLPVLEILFGKDKHVELSKCFF